MIHESGSNLSSKQKGALRSCANGEFLNEGGRGGDKEVINKSKEYFRHVKFLWGKGKGLSSRSPHQR